MRSFMFPLQTHYVAAIKNWLFNYPDRIVRKLQIASLLREGYPKAAAMQNAVSGFKKTGLESIR